MRNSDVPMLAWPGFGDASGTFPNFDFASFGMTMTMALLVLTLLISSAVLLKRRANARREIPTMPIFDHAQSAIALLDGRRQFIDANQGFRELTGYSLEELKTIKENDLTTDDNRSHHEAFFTALIESGRSGPLSTLYVTQQGRLLPVCLYACRSGSDGYWLLVEHDRAREYPNLTFDLLSTAVEQTPASVMITDHQASIIYVNSQFSANTGYDADEVIGHKPWDMMDLDLAHTTPGEIWTALSNGQSWTGELISRRKNGRHMFEEAHISPVKNACGEITHYLAIKTDITQRKTAEDRLRLAANVFSHAREGIMITDENGIITDANAAFCEMTGYRLDEMMGQNPRLFKSGIQSQDYYAELWQSLKSVGFWSGEIWNRNKSGDLYAALIKISSVPSDQYNKHHYVALYSDITRRKEYERQLEYIAHYDALTQLPNRVLLADRLKHDIDQAARRQTLLAVVYLDLDGFKAINDGHGHEAGDFLLTNVAKRMKYGLRKGDTLARLGGDEFVALLVDLTDIDSAIPLLQRLLQAASRPIRYGDLSFQVSASLGVTFYPQKQAIEADQLLRQADQAMYQAKIAGKNRYHIFDIEHELSMQAQQRTLNQLRRALKQQELMVYYQPIVNMRNGELQSVEALIRWQHPEQDVLTAAEFLPLIKNMSLLTELGQWVIRQVLESMRQWHLEGHRIPVSINIASDLGQSNSFLNWLADILATYPDVDPALLSLEIQETPARRQVDYQSLAALCRDLGLSLTIDNFGHEDSALSYLTKLPTRTIKLDKRFVQTGIEDSETQIILRSLLDIIKTFGCQAVIEGVENARQHAMLLELGYDYGQGFYFGKPMSAPALIDWLDQVQHWTA